MSPKKILYGVVGEGMGHAMRSAVILEHLTARGHDVRIVGSGRAAEYLEKRHPDRVTKITGLTMVYEDNEVRKLKTAFENLKALAGGVSDNLREYARMARDFSPDCVVSDFETWSYLFARGQKIPVISIDNMQVIARCHHEEDVLDDKAAFLLAKGIVKGKLPRCNSYLVTTFFYPPVKKERTSLYPPILRKIILDAKAKVAAQSHVLVYQSGTSHGELEDALRKVDVPFKVYGLRRDLKGPVTEGNVTFCPFSETTFIDDLATARAVVSGGGFTLMGEAIYLGKPMLSVPLVGQFEQMLNASYLTKLGFGERADEITNDRLTQFLGRVEEYKANLRAFRHDDNAGILSALDRAIEEAIHEGALAG